MPMKVLEFLLLPPWPLVLGAAGLGCGGLELVATWCIVEVSGMTAAAPRPGCEVLGPGATAAVPVPPAEVPGPAAAAPESDPTASGGAGTKMDSDSGEGLIHGLRRH